MSCHPNRQMRWRGRYSGVFLCRLLSPSVLSRGWKKVCRSQKFSSKTSSLSKRSCTYITKIDFPLFHTPFAARLKIGGSFLVDLLIGDVWVLQLSPLESSPKLTECPLKLYTCLEFYFSSKILHFHLGQKLIFAEISVNFSSNSH